MSELMKLTSGNNGTRSNCEIKPLLTNFLEVLRTKEPLEDLGKKKRKSTLTVSLIITFLFLEAFVANAVQYISMCPNAYDNPLPRSESDCIKKLRSLLNSKVNLHDGSMAGEIFEEHYNEATERVSVANNITK